MILIFTALLALSRFNPNLPKLEDFKTKPRAQIVQMYSKACLEVLTGPKGEMDLVTLIPALLATGEFQGSTKGLELFFESICRPDPDLGALNTFESEINRAMNNYLDLIISLPNVGDLKKLRLAQTINVLSSDGTKVGEIFNRNARRRWLPLSEMPIALRRALVAVEDRRFFDHNGVDEFGIFRAALSNSSKKGRPEGASTLSQQLARNLFLDNSLSFERKIKEILLASEIESQLSKDEIIELYLNVIYFGRDSWGIATAAESYFGKKASSLTITEMAFIVGLIHGPNIYQSKNSRTVERLNFVLNKMVEENVLPQSTDVNLLVQQFNFPPARRSINRNYLKDFVVEELNIRNPSWQSTQVTALRTTLNFQLQQVAEVSLQEGLINYEKSAGRYGWRGAVDNILESLNSESEKESERKRIKMIEVEKLKESLFGSLADSKTSSQSQSADSRRSEPFWLTPLARAFQRLGTPSSLWQLAVVLDGGKKIGLTNAKMGTLTSETLLWANSLREGDLIYVAPKGKDNFEIVQPPLVNGAVIAMNVESGDILALVGGFDSQLSPWNRAFRALRQPGSLMKPFTYMSALQLGYQPNQIVSGTAQRFTSRQVGGQSWVPKNYEGLAVGPRPMRFALEQSVNVMTANLMAKIGLGPIRVLAQDFGVYEKPLNNYPFILGAQETNLLSLVRAYAAMANGGYIVTPHAALLGADESFKKRKVVSVDDVTLFQMRYMLQGVVERGTAKRIASLSQFVAGKTGTSQDMRDAWFIGFTPNLVVGVYVGYDQPESLGTGFSGGRVALPIFEKIIRESFKIYKKEQAFAAAPPGVAFLPTDLVTGEILKTGTEKGFSEAYRKGATNETR